MKFPFGHQFDWSKRVWLRSTAAGGALLIAGGSSALFGQEVVADSVATQRPKVDKGPQLDAKMVKEFVAVSHRDLEAVKQLLNFQPALLNATWDWGGGDFEAGIEAASHVGDRDIALYLVEKGARPNIFLATMLGHLEIMKGYLSLYPAMINCKGPHGLSLIHHARKGGDQAKETLVYLESLGAM